MKTHSVLIFCLLLAGCTDADWDRTLNYTGLESSDTASTETPATTAPRPVAPTVAATPGATAAAPVAEAGNVEFCRSVAMQDATENGFDQPTQQRVFARSYAQCMAIYMR